MTHDAWTDLYFANQHAARKRKRRFWRIRLGRWPLRLPDMLP